MTVAEGSNPPARQQRKDNPLPAVSCHAHLKQLKDFLAEAAADAASDQGLTEDERARLIRQRDILFNSVDELETILAAHKDADVREDQLFTLFKALGSACFIASQRVADPTRERLRTAAATAKRKSPGTNDIIAELAKAVRGKNPRRTAHAVANEIFEPVNEWRKANGFKALQRDAIRKRVQKLGTASDDRRSSS